MMTKLEFKDMCHTEFLKRGFVKKKSSFYLIGTDGIQCKLSFQSSYGIGYYINCDYYLNNQTVYMAPAPPPDISGRVFIVPSKDTIKGKPFMTAGIYYSEYASDELLPYINNALDEYVMPPLTNGRNELQSGLKNGKWHIQRKYN